MKKYKFHLLGLVHLPTSEEYNACAFTQKNIKLVKMLRKLGHEVILYGSEGSDNIADFFVQTHTLKEVRDTWGEGDNRYDIGYDWKTKGFKHDFNTKKTELTKKYYQQCIDNINKNKDKDDFLLLTQGQYQRPIDNEVGLYLTCEPGVGYRGSYTKFKAFESSYLQNFTYGSDYPRQSIDGNYYDRVIPNFFDPQDYQYKEKKQDYFFYMGRLIKRKGVNTAIMVAQALKTKIIIAGQEQGESQDLFLNNPFVEYVGYADKEKRKKLLANAKATFVPSIYLEAFGGVAVESMFSGTPAITTNFGVFPETVVHGETGFRCNTLDQFVKAAKQVHLLKPEKIRTWAMNNYSMSVVKWKYQEWFNDLYELWESADNPNKKGWHRIK